MKGFIEVTYSLDGTKRTLATTSIAAVVPRGPNSIIDLNQNYPRENKSMEVTESYSTVRQLIEEAVAP